MIFPIFFNVKNEKSLKNIFLFFFSHFSLKKSIKGWQILQVLKADKRQRNSIVIAIVYLN